MNKNEVKQCSIQMRCQIMIFNKTERYASDVMCCNTYRPERINSFSFTIVVVRIHHTKGIQFLILLHHTINNSSVAPIRLFWTNRDHQRYLYYTKNQQYVGNGQQISLPCSCKGGSPHFNRKHFPLRKTIHRKLNDKKLN